MTPSATVGESPAHGQATIRTWEVFLVWSVFLVVASYYSAEAVMTRSVYQELLGGRLEVGRIDWYYHSVRQWAVVGRLLVPLFLAVRLLVVALIAQMVLLLLGDDVPLRAAFRAATFAMGPLVLQTLGQVLWLGQLDTAADVARDLEVAPLSLAQALLPAARAAEPLYKLLANINAFEVAWVCIFALALGRLAGVRRWRAVGAALFCWGLAAAVRWSLWYLTARAL